jgi:predicted site-specific integrase-resolvase
MRNLEPITSAEAGAILGVSARTVQRRADEGLITCIRKLPGPNGDYLFDRAEVEKVAAGQAKARAS